MIRQIVGQIVVSRCYLISFFSFSIVRLLLFWTEGRQENTMWCSFLQFMNYFKFFSLFFMHALLLRGCCCCCCCCCCSNLVTRAVEPDWLSGCLPGMPKIVRKKWNTIVVLSAKLILEMNVIIIRMSVCVCTNGMY